MKKTNQIKMLLMALMLFAGIKNARSQSYVIYFDNDLDGVGGADVGASANAATFKVNNPQYASYNLCGPCAFGGDCDDWNASVAGICGPVNTYYHDMDGDGYGAGFPSTSQSQPIGWVTNNLDCDYMNSAYHPGATDICNDGIDQDCSGSDYTGLVYYPDNDGDGYGNSAGTTITSCNSLTGYAANSSDCNDGSNTIYPGATEILCNGIDENCNGMADDGTPSAPAAFISSDATGNEICLGGNAILTVHGGSLGSSANWQWYIGSCGGTSLGTGASILVSPTTANVYFVRAESGCNTTACVQLTITVKTTAPVSSVTVPINNLPASACNGTLVLNANVPIVANASSYTWDGPTGTTFNGSGNPYTSTSPNANIIFGNPNGSGYYIGVQASNACGTSARKSQWVRGTVGVPAFIIPPSGMVIHCASTSATFTCPAVTGATQYLWSITGDATVSGTGTTALVTFGPAWASGTLCVAAQTACYTSAVKCLALTNFTMPSQIINGTTPVCPGQTNTYSVLSVNGAASYNWILPPGSTGISTTNSINVTFNSSFIGGDIKVQTVSICGVASAFKSKSLYSGVPPKPASISGPLTGLCGQTIVYTCPTQTGVTFTWAVPATATINSGQGTNAVSVTFGTFGTGTVCVTASTSCGTSPARCITAKGSPNAPGAITSLPSAWCSNTAGVEFNVDVSALSGSYTLSWLYPGASVAQYVLGGGNSTSLILNWLSGSGQLNVTAFNACGGQTRTSMQASSCREDIISATTEASELYVYPNPVFDILNIEFVSSEYQHVSIRLSDLTGHVISSSEILTSKGLNKSQLDVSNLAKGIYMLQAISNKNKFTKRIVKN